MSLFSRFSERHIPAIDDALDTLVSNFFSDERAELEAAVRHSLLAPGKRVRPLLTLSFYALFNADVRPILPVATAIECIHTYSLIHDDLPSMDNDDFRRGLPTCHKAFGEDMAILAGDLLNTLAFEHLATALPAHFSAEESLLAIRHLATASGIYGMIGGQVLDIKGSPLRHGADHLILTHRLKTGAIIESAIMIPVLLSGVSAPTLASCKTISQKLGLLFQIVDDILDVTGTQDSLGKSPNKDQEQNKVTYVSLYGLDGATEKARALHTSVQSHLRSIPDIDATVLLDFTDFLVTRVS